MKREQWNAIGQEAKANWDNVMHPIDSLGTFESIVVRLCQIQGSAQAPDIAKRAAVVFSGDHGVVAEGVTQTGQDVTKIVAELLATGQGLMSRFAKVAGADVYVIDVGMNTEPYPDRELGLGRVTDRKIRRGTRNLAREAAMTEEECMRALETGIEVCGLLKAKGYNILTAGEMGIGNTTPTAALAAAFLDMKAEEVTGRGAGLNNEGFLRKIAVVDASKKRLADKGILPWQASNAASTVTVSGIEMNRQALAILAECGGLEIAAMAGLYLGGLKHGVAVVIDGIISSVAALTAARLNPDAECFMIASHASSEPAALRIEKELKLEPVIHAGMHQGEGTGAVMMLPLLDMAVTVYREMGNFEVCGVETYQRMNETALDEENSK